MARLRLACLGPEAPGRAGVARPMRAAAAAALLAGLLAAPLPAGADAVAAPPTVSAAFGPDGRLWRVIPGQVNLQVDFSADAGSTWSAPVVIAPKRQRLRADPEGRPQIAIDRQGVVYVAWTADARKASQSFVTWSTDGGSTFAVPVSPGAPAPVAPQIRVFLRAAADSAQLYFLDPMGEHDHGEPAGSGTLFESTLRPARTPAPGLNTTRLAGSTCQCCRLDVDAEADGTRVVLTRMVFDGDIRDFGLVRLAGTTATVSRVTDDDWHIDACPEHGAALSIGTDGRYHLAWFTQGNRRRGLFYAWSDDRGRTLSTPLPIGDQGALAGHGDVLARDGQVYLVWLQFDGEQTTVLAMVSGDNGRAWSMPRRLAATRSPADYPFLLTDGRRVYVSWYATTPGYQLIPLVADEPG